MRFGASSAIGSVVVLLALMACAGPDLSDVPTKAKAPFVCDGVQATGAEKILGTKAVQGEPYGTWGREGSGFQCTIKPAKGGDGRVTVEEWDLRVRTGGDAANALRAAADERDAAKIDADAEGAGYVIGTSHSGSATWVCGDRILAVDLLRVEVKGRDQRADAEAFLVSMLPWACDDEDPPKGTNAN